MTLSLSGVYLSDSPNQTRRARDAGLLLGVQTGHRNVLQELLVFFSVPASRSRLLVPCARATTGSRGQTPHDDWSSENQGTFFLALTKASVLPTRFMAKSSSSHAPRRRGTRRRLSRVRQHDAPWLWPPSAPPQLAWTTGRRHASGSRQLVAGRPARRAACAPNR